jgi:hypothetical protein
LIYDGRREHDATAYQVMGPVTVDEYKSGPQGYDSQLMQKYEINIENEDTAQKGALLRKFRIKAKITNASYR